MKHYRICLLALAALGSSAMAGLKVSQKAPDFSAKASLAGKAFDFSLAAALKKGPVVVYFYPAAFTGGCNIEAHGFAENADKFAAAHATIIGVSGDSIKRLNDFSSDPQYCAGKFPVASDPMGAIGKSFGLTVTPSGDGAQAYKDSRGIVVDNKIELERTTFVITPDHKVAATFSSAQDKIKAGDHVQRSLAFVQSLAARKN